MPKHIILISLLFLWIFAIVAPSIITLVESNPKSVVVNNLNEEEHQKQGKKDIGEKLFTITSSIHNLIWYSKKEGRINNMRVLGYFNLPSEILLPPPRNLIYFS